VLYTQLSVFYCNIRFVVLVKQSLSGPMRITMYVVLGPWLFPFVCSLCGVLCVDRVLIFG